MMTRKLINLKTFIMILLHLHDGSPIQINLEMFIYVIDNLKLPKIAKIVYTNSVTKKVYCSIPFQNYSCVSFSPPKPNDKKDFQNLVPSNFYTK